MQDVVVKTVPESGQEHLEHNLPRRSLPLRLKRLDKSWTILLASLLVVLLGILDYATGHNFALSAFYLVPISWVCWVGGRELGLTFAMVSAGIWLMADLMTAHPYAHPAIPYWNAITLLILFVVVVVLQSDVLAANAHLEDTVLRRTEALRAEVAERKRLEKANLQAERLAMVGTIAAQVAHEVRNPLGSITLNLDLIAKEIEKMAIHNDTIEASAPTPSSPEEERETSSPLAFAYDAAHSPSPQPVQEGRILVQEMREEVRRIQRVIEEYLKFARLPKLQRKPVRLDEFLDQKLAFMGSVFKSAGVQLRTDFDVGLKTIKADPEQLWQAILNLVQNSLEAMPTGGVLAVSTKCENRQVLLRVTDSGKGMTGEQREQLFVPFFTTKPRGTGLGLPLTQRILNEHAAQIECASAVGQGSTFTIRFPLEELA